MYRSTKGASKARRDQINAEIRNLRDLLPISEADKARLSYLHIMSLACMYTRKSVFFYQDVAAASGIEESARFLSFHELSEFVQAMPGFLMLLTAEGKLLYLSDSVSEHLGHSMVDLVAQGDSVFDIIDPTDHFIMRSNLVPPTSPDTDRLFRCRFNTSKSVRRQSAGNKLVLIRARCLSPPPDQASPGTYWTSNPVWVCFCAPLEPHPPRPGTAAEQPLPLSLESSFLLPCFRSQHSRDMRLQEAQDSVSVYLGMDVATLCSRSWYSLLHPQDLTHASTQHCSLLREGGEGRAEMVVRVEASDHSWVWLYMVLQLETGENPISSNNYIISESEAWSVRQQLSSEETQLSGVLSTSTSQQETLSLQSPETLSSPDQVFTPGSSGLSAQSFDFSTAVCSAGSTEEQAGSSAMEPMPLESGPRSSLSSLEEETFFQQPPSEPVDRPSAASSPDTVATVSDLDFLTQNILLPPAFQVDPPLPALPLPLPPVPTSQSQQTKEFVCTPPYTPQLGSSSFPFGEPLFSFDPTGATTPPPLVPTATVTTTAAPSLSPSAPSNPQGSPAPPTTTLSTLLPLTLPAPSTEILFPVEPCSGALYEKLPPTPDSPGDGDCTVMTLPEVRGPLYVDVPHGPLPYPPEGLLTPEASPGKQSNLSFFTLEREREKDRTEISLLAQHISTLAEGFYLDPLLSKLLPSSISPQSPSPSLDSEGLETVPRLGEFYPVKSWRGLDLPLFPDDDSLFEESVLESLLQDLSSPSLSPTPSSPSSAPSSPLTPECWRPTLHFDGVSVVSAGHFCSVQSARCNHAAGCGATMSPVDAGDMADVKLAGEVAMETEAVSSPVSTGIPASPLHLTASLVSPAPASSPASPASCGLPCAQSLLEELAALEPMFGAGASITPGLGQQPELYQLQSHLPQQCFRKDGSGSDPPF
ncbi:neuronal PAS domain-containing protein 4A [Electrophorus electricus]|uniref:Neuronal PAS domain protein 4 n=1 Tax=Electrophorus electricus TaxID=8005 RepID=A0A4W4GUI9_ELEEL|nr:neuronal PAS domain-containing protein 4A [Electrophorus electricus]